MSRNCQFQVEILEAAIRYIDRLHGQLVASVESAGGGGGRLPSALLRQIGQNQATGEYRVTHLSLDYTMLTSICEFHHVSCE